MKKILNKKSPKIRERIEVIIAEIKSYQKSIDLLDGYAEGRLFLRGNTYTDGARRYKRTLEDNRRYHWTRKHITFQIALLERELKVLIEYAA